MGAEDDAGLGAKNGRGEESIVAGLRLRPVLYRSQKTAQMEAASMKRTPRTIPAIAPAGSELLATSDESVDSGLAASLAAGMLLNGAGVKSGWTGFSITRSVGEGTGLLVSGSES